MILKTPACQAGVFIWQLVVHAWRKGPETPET